MLPLVVMVQHVEQGSTRHFAFADSPVRLGRSPFAELQLEEEFVSRWEGTLRFDDNQVTYFNLSATNPTFVNGRQVAPHEEIPVTPDTVIAIGQLSLRFVRMPVPEADLRRRGKRVPVANTERGEVKTVWLGALQPQDKRAAVPASPVRTSDRPASERPSPAVAKPASERPLPTSERSLSGSERPASTSERPLPFSQRPAGPSERPPVSASQPAPASSGTSERPASTSVSVRAMQAVAIGRTHGVTSQGEQKPPSVAPPAYQASPEPERRPPMMSTTPPPAQAGGTGVEHQHTRYREAWEELLRELTRELENAAEGDRVALSDRLQRRYPQIVLEPGFRAVLKRLNLEARKPDIPEISEWLRTIAEGVLPPQFRLDTGLTLERILGLLEILSESIGELNDAQDSVRKRWLGRAPRGSIMQSDNGRVILAYLLNPRADWNERVSEVEESMRNLVMHEIALFKATLEGARALLDALSPETLAKAEEMDLAALEEGAGGAGIWQRLTSRDDPRVTLWKRFVSTYESLKDGARYQRVFMGRPFARTYLAAMGQGESADTTQPTG